MKTLNDISVDDIQFSIKTMGILRHQGIATMGQLDELGPEGRAALPGASEKVRDEMHDLLIEAKYKLLLEYAPRYMDPGFMRFDRKLDLVMDTIDNLQMRLTKTHRLLDELMAERSDKRVAA